MILALRVLVVLTVAVFAALLVLSYGFLSAGGQTVFDDRIAGYGVGAARAYLAALSDAQTSLYLGLFRVLDTFLPVLVALTLGGFTWSQTVGTARALRLLIALGPAVYMMLDLRENALVAHLLEVGPQVPAEAILHASAHTVSKFIALMLAVLLAVWAWRRPSAAVGGV